MLRNGPRHDLELSEGSRCTCLAVVADVSSHFRPRSVLASIVFMIVCFTSCAIRCCVCFYHFLGVAPVDEQAGAISSFQVKESRGDAFAGAK